MGLNSHSQRILIYSDIFATVLLLPVLCTFSIIEYNFGFEFFLILVMQGGSLSSVTTLMSDFQASMDWVCAMAECHS